MKKWSLNLKIVFVISILILGSICISGMSLYQMGGINSSLEEITDVRVKSVMEAEKIRQIFYTQIINERNFMIYDTLEGKARVAELIVKRDKEIRDLINERKKHSDPHAAKNLDEFVAVYENWHKTNAEVVKLMVGGKEKEGLELILSKGRDLRLAGEAATDKMVQHDIEEMNKTRKAASDTYSQAKTLTSFISLLSILIGVTMAFLVLRAASRAIHQVISDLQDNSTHVTQASRQIASASEELSSASTEQASSLEETVATLEELTSMVKLNSSNAKEAARLASLTREIAIKGESEIRLLVNSMGVISEDSRKIEEITSVVDDIAFQTNLLALNAAVEAARAGEQGKGFAVVAEAVRNLAQRSSSAAKDIADLIKGSVAKIEVGSQQASQSGRVLEEIVNSVKKVSDLNSEIATASEEQSHGIQQIGKAMNQLDQVTQVNAATSEEAAASAQELSSQSESLSNAVHILIEAIDGVKAADVPRFLSHQNEAVEPAAPQRKVA
ncbi:methyl-accepting chemotaxis protein [Bdellovibrio sp. ArHS]|uniref:methyl-accepting chemotaxis protein n=1 Tax=Bdellovibrio sp. ArHS TaxID=1569284 RepID=UPI0025C0B3BF|nr:methyl-accepting chemotaxis protein [Bdellovibrio sp. ArHS]